MVDARQAIPKLRLRLPPFLVYQIKVDRVPDAYYGTTSMGITVRKPIEER
ncbi:unnamed protein product, partial [marine sediment metagenome]